MAVEAQRNCILARYGLSQSLDKNCLVLHGTSDRAVYPRNSEAVVSTVGDGKIAELQMIEGCGHFIWATHALDLCNAVQKYLAKGLKERRVITSTS